MKTKNEASRRLWEIDYAIEPAGTTESEKLLILAKDASEANRKALRFLKDRGDRNAEVRTINSGGVIDVL